MYLEGVIVCVGYSDFMSHTLPYIKHQFDRLVIVTDTKDEDTRKLCEHLYVECIQTDSFYENGDKFNKGNGINAGLNVLSKKGWVVHLDADIYLPPMFRKILDNIMDEMPQDNLYGIDRMMCPDYASWVKFKEDPSPLHEGWIYVHPNQFPMGVRIAEYMSKGWEVIGFFQMWNPIASNVFSYPNKHGAADRTDVQFCKKWPRGKRQMLPEIIGIHLESENLDTKEMGKNWNGRKTIPFTFDYTVGKKEERKALEEIAEEKRELSKSLIKGYRKPFHKRVQQHLKNFFNSLRK